MTYDPRFDAIARELLSDCEVSTDAIKHYADRLAQQLHDVTEDFIRELPDLERDAEDTAEDESWQSALDEVRGK